MFSLENSFMLDMVLPFLQSMFLLTPPSVSLHNALLTIIVFHTTLLLTQKLILQQEVQHWAHIHRILWYHYVPVILKQLA